MDPVGNTVHFPMFFFAKDEWFKKNNNPNLLSGS